MTARNSILIRNAQKLFASIIDKETNKTVNENKFHWKKGIKSSEKKKEQKDFMTKVKSKMNLVLSREHKKDLRR